MPATSATLAKQFGSAWHVQGAAILADLGVKIGSGSPVSGGVVPSDYGDLYVDSASNVAYVALGLTSAGWTQLEGAGENPSFNSLTVTSGAVVSGGLTISGGETINGGETVNGGLTIGAGGSGLSPLTLTSGTLMTSPPAGVVEYDGGAYYGTVVSGSRQQLDAEQYTIASANSATYNNTGLDTASAAAVFTATMGGSASGAVTLAAGKTYCFEACYSLTNTGTTSHTWAALFGGTATFTGSNIQAFGNSATSANTPATGGLTGFGSGTDLTFGGNGIVCTAAQTSATEQVTIQLSGTIVVNAGGTLIPELKASARPGATGTPGVIVKAGSYFRIWEMAPAATVGNWS